MIHPKNSLPTISVLAFLVLGTQEPIRAATGPCDLYEAAGTACVAAHSTVRALYASYSGNLYQVRRKSDGTKKDIGLLSTGGYANSATQDAFCANTTCTISEIYDQSPKGNHLLVTTKGGWLNNGGTEADAVAAKIKIDGHTVYGVFTSGTFDDNVGGVGYRNNKTMGIATGNQAEGMYMVAGGKHTNQWCCFDYGNAQVTNTDNGNSTMEALYWGTSVQWGHGLGTTGPWIMGDLENGLEAGSANNSMNNDANTPIVADYVIGTLKSKTDDWWSLRGGDANNGTLKTMYSGAHVKGWYPKKLEGAVLLGVGGDNSHTGAGTFFEGAMIIGCPTDAVEDAVQANVVAAGYGRATTSIQNDRPTPANTAHHIHASLEKTVFDFSLSASGNVTLDVLDMTGRRIATLAEGLQAAGSHRLIWNAQKAPEGLYLARMIVDGKKSWSERIVLGR
jgi:hypothetical protein